MDYGADQIDFVESKKATYSSQQNNLMVWNCFEASATEKATGAS